MVDETIYIRISILAMRVRFWIWIRTIDQRYSRRFGFRRIKSLDTRCNDYSDKHWYGHRFDDSY